MKTRLRHRRGLTLMELVVALAIIAMMFAGAAIGVGSLTGTKAKAAAGELTGVIRALYDTAALSGKTCRLVFELPPAKSEEGAVRYRAECAAGNVTTAKDRDDQLEQEADVLERRQRAGGDDRFTRYADKGSSSALQDMLAQEKDRVEGSAKFSAYTDAQIEPRELDGSVRVWVWTRHQQKAVTSGPAYLYFFPQGFTEKAQIYVRQGDNVWTLSVSPLTGKTSVVAEELEVPRS